MDNRINIMGAMECNAMGCNAMECNMEMAWHGRDGMRYRKEENRVD